MRNASQTSRSTCPRDVRISSSGRRETALRNLSRESGEPILWVVDSEQWPRACLRAELIERGYDAYGFITIADALDSLARGATRKPQALILELRGQELTEDLMEALRNLAMPIILLGGNA